LTRLAVGQPEKSDRIERQAPVTGPRRPLPRFAYAPESPSETLGGVSLASSPSALGIPRALGSSGSEPRGISRRIPRRSSPALPRHLSGLALPLVASRERLGRPCLLREAPRVNPQPFSITGTKNPFSRWARDPASERLCVPPGSPAFRVWLPSWRRQLSDLREPVSAPHALGLRSSGLCSDPAANPRFPKDLPLLRFRAKPCGLTSALQRLAPAEPAAPPALPPLSGESGDLALLSFRTSQAFLRWTFEEVSSLSVPLPPFPPRPPKKPRPLAPGDSFQRPGISPLSRGAGLSGVPGRLPSATSLEREPVAAYFFGSELPKPLRAPRGSSLRPIPPRLTGSGTAFRLRVAPSRR
jgi:hypothetical protein